MGRKRIVLVHYHLGPGGIGRVMAHQASAMRNCGWEVGMLVGAQPAPAAGFEAERITILPGLTHCDGDDVGTARELVIEMRRGARRMLGGDPDVWVVHNHALGTNLHLTRAVQELARDGERLLLHTHDWAEDNRPKNYRRLRAAFGGAGGSAWSPHPIGAGVHYGVLTRRDERAVLGAGVGSGRVHLLPNPAILRGAEEAQQSDPCVDGIGRLFVYPSRAIRRKNLGELVLWSALGEPGDSFASTLVPTDPGHRAVHDRWVEFAGRHRLPVRFGVREGATMSLGEMLMRSSGAVTTSVAEGFGLAFLEPWLVGCPVYGRDLPWLTCDFREEGIDLGHLYERFDVPLDWVGAGRVEERLRGALRGWEEAHAEELGADRFGRIWERACRAGSIDFGFLDEPFQERVIERLVTDRAARRRLGPAPWQGGVSPGVIGANRAAVRERYSLERYAEVMRDVIERVGTAAPGGGDAGEALDPRGLLEAFMDPAGYTLLRA